MPLTQPGAASTTHATRPRRPVHPRKPAIKLAPDFDREHHSGKLLWVYCVISSSINADTLFSLGEKQRNRAHSRAIFDGYSKLREDVRESVKKARDEGLLLFCWQGTTVLEVPA